MSKNLKNNALPSNTFRRLTGKKKEVAHRSANLRDIPERMHNGALQINLSVCTRKQDNRHSVETEPITLQLCTQAELTTQSSNLWPSFQMNMKVFIFPIGANLKQFFIACKAAANCVLSTHSPAIPAPHSFLSVICVSPAMAGLLSLLHGAGSFGRIWSACGHNED